MHRSAAVCATIVSGVLMFASFSLPAYAQLNTTTNPLSVDVEPQNPSPYQTVQITPSSSQIDLNASTVTVTVNGSKVYSGSGSAPITAQVGGPGVTTTIDVSATYQGQSYSQEISIVPEQLALVTEPTSTTHPFYEGKGLVSPQGAVRFIALPDFRTSSGKSIDPSTLEYTWSMNDQVLESDSGIGDDVLDAQAPDRYRDVTLSVTVQTTDGSLVAQASTPVSPVDPITRIYEDDPLLGPLFNTALSGQVSLSGDEETFLGVPYYFSEAPALDWQVNGADSGTNGDITVRATGNGQGTASLSFEATQSDTVQTANSTVNVQFGTPATGILGL